jgi:hypothetical protein
VSTPVSPSAESPSHERRSDRIAEHRANRLAAHVQRGRGRSTARDLTDQGLRVRAHRRAPRSALWASDCGARRPAGAPAQWRLSVRPSSRSDAAAGDGAHRRSTRSPLTGRFDPPRKGQWPPDVAIRPVHAESIERRNDGTLPCHPLPVGHGCGLRLLLALGVSAGTILAFGAVLACRLMMVFMMGGMAHGAGGNGALPDEASGAQDHETGSPSA